MRPVTAGDAHKSLRLRTTGHVWSALTRPATASSISMASARQRASSHNDDCRRRLERLLSEKGDVRITRLTEKAGRGMQKQIEAGGGGTAETDHAPENPMAEEPARDADDVVMAGMGHGEGKELGGRRSQAGGSA